MECAFVPGGVALGEGHFFFPTRVEGRIAGAAFQDLRGLDQKRMLMITGTLQTPVLFGHFADQDAFGGSGRLVFGDQLVQESIELV